MLMDCLLIVVCVDSSAHSGVNDSVLFIMFTQNVPTANESDPNLTVTHACPKPEGSKIFEHLPHSS